MKKLVLLLSVIALVSCDKGNQREQIEKKIDEKKKEVREIEKEIGELEDKLASLPGDGGEKYQLPVKIKVVKPETFNHYITVNGSVEAVNSAYISPEQGGQIKKIHVKEGQRVGKGQLLVTLNTSVTRNTIKEVETQLELAKKLYEKQKNLWEQNIGSEVQFLQAKTNKESLENKLKTLKSQLAMSLIHAPFSGIIEEIPMKEGELASPGMRVVQIVNLSKIKIEADVSEKYITKVDEGDKVKVSFSSYEDLELEVPIVRKGNTIEPDNRTFKIEVQFKNPDNKIKPNMMSTITINDYTTDSALIVPAIIVKQDFNGNYLYHVVEDEQGHNVAKKAYVKTGRSYNDETVINEGIKPGFKVVTSGYNLVSNGSYVNIK